MAMLANLRPLPGLYGGGFARVVQVEAFPSGAFGGAVSKAAVRLERLKDPLAGFQQSLTQFTQNQTAGSRPAQSLDADSLTLLQNVNPEQPIVAPFPPERLVADSTDDSSSYAIELARIETLREQARAEDARKQAAREEALRLFNEANASVTQFGPDPLNKLQQEFQPLTGDLKLASLEYSQLTSTDVELSPYIAAQAAQAYASGLASAG